jgi:hypothetical protein
VDWSISTLDESGWIVAKSDAVCVIGIGRSAPARDVDNPAPADDY